jgi:hypothetical protein
VFNLLAPNLAATTYNTVLYWCNFDRCPSSIATVDSAGGAYLGKRFWIRAIISFINSTVAILRRSFCSDDITSVVLAKIPHYRYLGYQKHKQFATTQIKMNWNAATIQSIRASSQYASGCYANTDTADTEVRMI